MFRHFRSRMRAITGIRVFNKTFINFSQQKLLTSHFIDISNRIVKCCWSLKILGIEEDIDDILRTENAFFKWLFVDSLEYLSTLRLEFHVSLSICRIYSCQFHGNRTIFSDLSRFSGRKNLKMLEFEAEKSK